jgi:hypothetical protein
MFSIVTESQLALEGNYDRVCCLKHVGTEGVMFVRPDPGERSQGKFKELLPEGKHELAITLCYCSVLADCWVASSGDPMLDGRAITSDGCPITVDDRFIE